MDEEAIEDCPHDDIMRDGDLRIWRCVDCGEETPWSADVRLGRNTREP